MELERSLVLFCSRVLYCYATAEGGGGLVGTVIPIIGGESGCSITDGEIGGDRGVASCSSFTNCGLLCFIGLICIEAAAFTEWVRRTLVFLSKVIWVWLMMSISSLGDDNKGVALCKLRLDFDWLMLSMYLIVWLILLDYYYKMNVIHSKSRLIN